MNIKKRMLTVLAAISVVLATVNVTADEVNIYSFRQPFLIQPIMDKFTQQTGIKVNILSCLCI